MSQLINSQQNNSNNLSFSKDKADYNEKNPDLNIQAHYSNNMKVNRARRTVNSIPNNLPSHHLISPHDLDLRMRTIDTDIYEGAKKEHAKHEFNSKLYIKIFGGVTLTALILSLIHKMKK